MALERKVIELKPLVHQCFPLAMKYNGVCPLCTEHAEKKKKFIRQSRWRARMRQGIVV